MGSIRRGRILRDTSAGDGLVFVGGQQYTFRLEGMWKSEFAPKVNMLVDAEFDDEGRLVGVRTASVEAVTSAQTAQAIHVAKATTRTIARDARSDGLPVLAQYAQQIGYPTLGTYAALLLGWFYFSAISIDLGMGGRMGLTFYGVLKFLNMRGIQDMMSFVSGGGAGVYGLLCFVCCGGVLLPWMWRDRRANYGLIAPLVFMVLMGLFIRHKFFAQLNGFEQSASQFGSMGDAHAQAAASQFATNVVTKVRDGISLAFGAWLSLAASAYLAWRGIQRLRGEDPGSDPESDVEERPQPRGRPPSPTTRPAAPTPRPTAPQRTEPPATQPAQRAAAASSPRAAPTLRPGSPAAGASAPMQPGASAGGAAVSPAPVRTRIS